MEKNQDLFWVDFQRSEEEEPRFVRSGGLPGSEERKRTKIRLDELWINGRTKIRKFGWASDKQRNQDLFGWTSDKWEN
ncbi:unnamed protein product [Rhizophagus irregularis]|nr:unnamed protein product [Rhizophagus irregularis]